MPAIRSVMTRPSERSLQSCSRNGNPIPDRSSCPLRPFQSGTEHRRRITFTEDRKDHEDNPFDVNGRRLVPPLHSRNGRSASDQGTRAGRRALNASARNVSFGTFTSTFSEKGFTG